MKYFFLILLSFSTLFATDDKSVLLTILARNKAHVLPLYLECLEALDYDKSLITVYINTNDNEDATQEILEVWAERNETLYHKIIFKSHSTCEHSGSNPHDWTASRLHLLRRIRNESLQRTLEEGCDFYFVVDCDNFITPCTLRELVAQNRSIIAPMLRSVPVAADRYSNYFCDVTPTGYWKSAPSYDMILKRSLKGVIEVPVVHCTYLVRADVIDQLTYLDPTDDYDFVIFSREARKRKIPQYVYNEKDFGVLLHFPDVDAKKFTLEDEIAAFDKYLKTRNRPLIAQLSLPVGLKVCTTPRGQFFTRTNDQHIGWVLAQGRHWEENLVALCLALIRPGSTVVDMGANLGTHAIPWAQKAATVYAFEPQRLIFHQLCANVLLNGCKNVHCIQAALGDQMRTLDSLELSNVSLLRVDVEGEEPLVFYGARETIRKNRPAIVYEKRPHCRVTQPMDLPPEVVEFDIEAFAASLDYFGPQQIGKSHDYLLIPKPAR